jgi:ABC-type Fe3+ transport system permease subunit
VLQECGVLIYGLRISASKKAFRSKREENPGKASTSASTIPLYKRHGGEKALFVIMAVIFVLFSITFIFPFVWVLYNAFKTTAEFNADTMAWPTSWNWSNFAQAFTFSDASTHNYNLFQMLGMSVLVAGGGTIATVITSVLRRLGRRQIQIPGPRHHLRRRDLLAHRPDRWSPSFSDSADASSPS